MVTLSKIIDGLEMVDDMTDCYYNPEKDEIFLSSIGEYGDLSEDEIDELFEESIILPTQKVERIIKQLKEQSGLTEEMKNSDPLYWVGMMNNFKKQAEEIVGKELIYV